MVKKQSNASLAQQGLRIIDSIKQVNYNSLNEQSFQ